MNFTLRQSQALNTFGVGAIVDFNQQSVIPTNEWALKSPDGRLGLPIVENYLLVEIRKAYPSIQELYPYPETDDEGASQAMMMSSRRFPGWLYCPNCGKLKRYQDWRREFRRLFPVEPTERFSSHPYCPMCRESRHRRIPLMPTRFVVACEHGHLSDFPWVEWCHNDPHPMCDGELSIDTGAGEGISSIVVKCSCGAHQSLGRAFGEGALQRIMPNCPRETPWKGHGARDVETCSASPRVVQRGGSNIYYPQVKSSISLPEEKLSDREKILSINEATKVIDYFRRKTTPPMSGVLEPPVADKESVFEMAWNVGCEMNGLDAICANRGVSLESAKKVLKAECLGSGDDADADNREGVEFETFSKEWSDGDSDRSVLTVVEQDVGALDAKIAGLLKCANLITRLRVVSVLTHFSRLLPPNVAPARDDDSRAVVLQRAYSPKATWLPAYQGYGEGLFIALDPRSVERWAASEAVRKEAAEMNVDDPAYVLVHTFSHFLMKALAVCCGYSLTALQEKIYSIPSGHQYGLLIYTSAPDVHGTLGGLVRQGDVKELSALVRNAILDACSCSNDPICSDTAVDPQAFSRAACYACAFLPETSCCTFNRFLNRRFLVDKMGGGSQMGFFNDLI